MRRKYGTSESSTGANEDAPFRVGEWHVDPPANEITHDSETVRLEPKAMQVLCILARHAGNVVSREDLEAQAWPRVVVTTDAVTGAVIKLRRALGDQARRPSYIETVSKSGYRLIAPVTPTPPASAPPRPERPSGRWARIPLLLVLVALVAGAWLWRIALDGWPASPEVDSGVFEDKTSIAVLPFENLGPAPEQDYFADGITEDLTTDLSKLPGLRVIARDSAMAYKNSQEDPRRIAEQLRVDYLLKGSVRRDGQRLRLNVRLIDGRRATNLWGERYDREIGDLFAIQDQVARQIIAALALRISLGEQSQPMRRRLASVEAYDELLQGLDHYGRRSLEDTRSAILHFQRAIAIDPGFARAYVGLAQALTRDAVDGWELEARDALDHAAELTEKARRLDPSVPQIYLVEGQIALSRRNYEEAIRSVEHAIAIKPSYADAYALTAWILHFAGRPTQGLAAMARAIELNPRVPAIYRLVRGALYYSLDELDKARADLQEAVEVSPSFELLRIWLAAAYAGAGSFDEAQWEAQEILTLDSGFTLAHVERSFPIRDPDYLARLVADLRRAGLPD